MYRQFLVFSIVSLILITSCKETRYDLDIPTSTVETNDTILLQNIEHNHSNVGRAIWQKPGLVIEKLGDISDKVIADIGAGTGYFSFRLAPRAKKVIAIEIDEALIKYIDSSKIK